ncbi:MAG: histidine kinase [Bacteroidetes bacterium]|nr:histidine kinase [Bacteroidota bacterium]
MTFFDKVVYSKTTSVRIFRHIIFWSADCVSNLVVLSADTEIKTPVIINRICVIPLIALVTYTLIYYLLPGFFRDKNRLKLLVGIVILILFVGYGIRYYRLFIVYPIIDPTHVLPANVWSFSHVYKEVFRWMPGISLAVAIKMMKNKTEIQEKAEQLAEEKKAAELAFLKAQMHPHFLFNTLNTLYSYSLQNDGKSEQVVLHLSNLMRYILEECDHRVIPIEKEIKVISDYFELKKLRHGTRLDIDFQIELKKSRAFISPLLMLPIIENSFKHTLSSARGLIHITVRIKTENKFIHLFVENDLLPADQSYSSRGLGIANVKRQLALLYGRNYSLHIKNDNGKYAVDLKVPVMNEYE